MWSYNGSVGHAGSKQQAVQILALRTCSRSCFRSWKDCSGLPYALSPWSALSYTWYMVLIARSHVLGWSEIRNSFSFSVNKVPVYHKALHFLNQMEMSAYFLTCPIFWFYSAQSTSPFMLTYGTGLSFTLSHTLTCCKFGLGDFHKLEL